MDQLQDFLKEFREESRTAHAELRSELRSGREEWRAEVRAVQVRHEAELKLVRTELETIDDWRKKVVYGFGGLQALIAAVLLFEAFKDHVK